MYKLPTKIILLTLAARYLELAHSLSQRDYDWYLLRADVAQYDDAGTDQADDEDYYEAGIEFDEETRQMQQEQEQILKAAADLDLMTEFKAISGEFSTRYKDQYNRLLKAFQEIEKESICSI